MTLGCLTRGRHDVAAEHSCAGVPEHKLNRDEAAIQCCPWTMETWKDLGGATASMGYEVIILSWSEDGTIH